MRRIAVGDVMTRNFVSVSPSSTLYECAKKMAKERVNSLLITEKKRLIGILTSRDILWTITKSSSTNLKKINCMKIATRKLAVIKPSADIVQAIEKMKTSNFRRLPVLSNNELIGVITLKDILAVEPTFYAETRSLMDIREEERKKEQVESSCPIEGICENCGALSDLLRVEGQLLCMDCRDELF
jgi:CBS domain-containing protein